MFVCHAGYIQMVMAPFLMQHVQFSFMLSAVHAPPPLIHALQMRIWGRFLAATCTLSSATPYPKILYMGGREVLRKDDSPIPPSVRLRHEQLSQYFVCVSQGFFSSNFA